MSKKDDVGKLTQELFLKITRWYLLKQKNYDEATVKEAIFFAYEDIEKLLEMEIVPDCSIRKELDLNRELIDKQNQQIKKLFACVSSLERSVKTIDKKVNHG